MKRKLDISRDDLEEWSLFTKVQNGVGGVTLPGYKEKKQEELARAKIGLDLTKTVIFKTLNNLLRH